MLKNIKRDCPTCLQCLISICFNIKSVSEKLAKMACGYHTQDISKVFFNTDALPAIKIQCICLTRTSVPVVLAAACIRSLNAVLYLALMTLNSSRNEKDGIT